MKNFNSNDFLPSFTQVVIGLILGILLVILTGCEKSYPTYPDINGDYVVSSVHYRVEYPNGDVYDTMYFNGTFAMYEPSTPLDSFEVKSTPFNITNQGFTFNWNKDNIGGTVVWKNSADGFLRQDILSGQWDRYYIYFTTTRVYDITYVGIDEFEMKLEQYPWGKDGPKCTVWYNLQE